jgi:hypothetical protein
MFWRKKLSDTYTKPPDLDRRTVLAGIPLLNPGVRCMNNDAASTMTVVVTVKRRKDFLGKFQPREWERKIELDELGAFIVGLIDGERSVVEMIDAFVARFKINRREAELSTMAFLKSLSERNVISVAIAAEARK